MRTSLRLRLIIFIITPLAISLAVGSVLVFKNYGDHLERRMQEDVELVARALQLPISRAIERGHEDVLEKALESVENIDRVFGLYVYDEEGRLIASMGDGLKDLSGRPEDEIGGPTDEESRYTEVSGRRVYSYFVPLMDAGNRVSGLLQVTRRASDIDETIDSLRMRVGLLLLLVVLVVSGLVVVGHRMAIGRPLLRLRQSMQRVEEGDRAHRSQIDGPTEMAQVAQTLNRMLDSLHRAEAEILSRKQKQWDLEQRLKHTEKLAAIGQLAAGVAHELGTPLSVIDGKAQRALRKPQLDPAQRATLEDMRAQVRRTEMIVRQLLDFGRRNVLNIQPTTPQKMAHAATGAVRARAEASATELVLAIDPDADALDVDPMAIERVLTNLIENAIDATPGGTVVIRSLAADGYQGFVVEDNGRGIKPEERSRVLEPFFTTKDVGEGTGLGLSVAHGLVEEHGGHLTIDANPSGGTTVTIAFPQRNGEGNG